MVEWPDCKYHTIAKCELEYMIHSFVAFVVCYYFLVLESTMLYYAILYYTILLYCSGEFLRRFREDDPVDSEVLKYYYSTLLQK